MLQPVHVLSCEMAPTPENKGLFLLTIYRDYQYKSICRGEHSIFGRVKAAGVDPEKYIYFFNLRSYDRLNVTPKVKKQEEESGVSYQDVQKAEAHKIMGDGIDGQKKDGEDGVSGPQDPSNKVTSTAEQERETDAIRKFEAHRDETDGRQPESKDRYVLRPNHLILYLKSCH